MSPTCASRRCTGASGTSRSSWRSCRTCSPSGAQTARHHERSPAVHRERAPMRIVSRGRAVMGRARAAPAREFDRAVAEFFMRLALDEAKKGVGKTSPNPAVGAGLVRNGHVLGRGVHAKAGGPHAEIVALRKVGARARGADLYTTLEPCNHQGRTPPCTEAILAAGIRRVFVGGLDANPPVRGRGVKRLRAAGVKVVTGVL